MSHAWGSSVRNDVVGGLVSAAVAIPLAMGYGMFALVSLGDRYFADGALAGLYTAFLVAIVSVVLGLGVEILRDLFKLDAEKPHYQK
jgi:MFS superfamily sulfate permease-like transporter